MLKNVRKSLMIQREFAAATGACRGQSLRSPTSRSEGVGCRMASVILDYTGKTAELHDLFLINLLPDASGSCITLKYKEEETPSLLADPQ